MERGEQADGDARADQPPQIWSLWRGDETNAPSLRARIRRLVATRNLSLLFVTGVFPLLVLIWWAVSKDFSLAFAAVVGYLELAAILVFQVSRQRLRDLQAELRTVEFENEILSQDPGSQTLLFLQHQAELKRYYDQALQQNRLAFVLGVFCVVAGLAVIGLGFALVQAQSGTEQIVTGTLAATGAILSGFVARVYLGIHRGAVKSVTRFHEKLVQTHHLHIAGVFVSRLESKQARDDALAALIRAAVTSSPEPRA
jgi:hypothetical protein